MLCRKQAHYAECWYAECHYGVSLCWMSWCPFGGRHDIERNDIQQNDSQQDGVKPNNWLNCKWNFCCLVTIESVIQLNVVTPLMKSPMRCFYLSYWCVLIDYSALPSLYVSSQPQLLSYTFSRAVLSKRIVWPLATAYFISQYSPVIAMTYLNFTFPVLLILFSMMYWKALDIKWIVLPPPLYIIPKSWPKHWKHCLLFIYPPSHV